MYLPLVIIIPLGLALGSFFNVCIYRIPRKESIAFPPSHCVNCGEGIKTIDLIPVLSFFLLRGKCRKCNEKISLRYPVVEIITGALFALLYFLYGLNLHIGYMIFMMLFTSILIVITFIDIEHKIIPDVIVLPGIVVGFLFNFIGSYFCKNALFILWYDSLLGMLAGGLPLFLLGILGSTIAKREAMGGGDVKLMAMVGAFIGWKLVLLALFAGVMIGAVIGIIIKARTKDKGYTEIPFGPMLAVGSLIAALYGDKILNWYFGMLNFY